MFEIFLNAYVFLFGLCIGSFLNVCIYRMGREKSVITPGSHCPACQKPIRWFDNIPVVSYLLLRGRCRDCGAKISFRYVFVELLTGFVFWALWNHFGSTPLTLAYAVMASGLIVATFVDFDFQIIPDEISIGGTVVGVILSLLIPQMHGTDSHLWAGARSLMGLLAGGGLLWALAIFGDFIFKKESMGGGDVKLMAMIGAFLGWKAVLLTLPVACVFGAIVGIIVKIRTKESLIPFGPYLSIGAMMCLFYQQELIRLMFYSYHF